MTSNRLLTLASCSALALWSAGVSQASAQTASPPAEDKAASGDEIIVTAQRRAERLQDVPIAISAFGSKAIEERGILSLTDLQGVVPGLNISGSSGSNGTNLVAIRGIVGQPITLGASQPTPIYLDGVFLPKPDGALFGLEDVERIEVLRGPQGTLYGRNATAGAINIITKEPSQQLGGKFNVNYGNYNTVNFGGYLTGGLGEHLAASISGSYNRHDGYYLNTFTGNQAGKSYSWTLRGKLRYDNGAVRATLVGDISRKRLQDVWQVSSFGPTGSVQFDTKRVAFNLPEDQDRTIVKSGGVGLTVEIDASDSFNITSISSYRSFYHFYSYDLDASTATLVHTLGQTKFETGNQEIRGTYSSGPFRLTVGANAYIEYGENRRQSNPANYTQTLLMTTPNPLSKSHLTALAAFAQTEYDIDPKLTLVGGVRLNHENRRYSVDYSAVGAFAPVKGSVEDTTVLPMASINFKPSRDVLLYAKVSEGYQAPGFANAPGAGVAGNTFGPEKLWAYEAGFKTDFFDRKLTFNAAGFYYKYTNLQVRQVTEPGVNKIINAGAARVTGVEGDVTLRPLPGLTLSAQASYTKAIFTRFCEVINTGTAPQVSDPFCVGTPSPTADRAGNSLPQAPRWSGGANIVYAVPLGDTRELKLSGTYAAETNSYYQPNNSPLVATAGWYRLDARAELNFARGLSVYAFGRNLTDKRYVTNGFYYRGSGLVTLNDPRTYGVGMTARF